jgi:CheY-like chemotaxis protein
MTMSNALGARICHSRPETRSLENVPFRTGYGLLTVTSHERRLLHRVNAEMSGWNGNPPRVLLLVQPELRSALVEALCERGYDVEDRESPDVALTELRRGATAPHTVILDWALPGSSSHDFLRNFASNPRFTRSHVIVLSESRADAIPSLCVSAILPKPISPEVVLSTVEALGKR